PGDGRANRPTTPNANGDTRPATPATVPLSDDSKDCQVAILDWCPSSTSRRGACFHTASSPGRGRARNGILKALRYPDANLGWMGAVLPSRLWNAPPGRGAD